MPINSTMAACRARLYLSDNLVIISEAFSNKFGKREGDTLSLPTPKGMHDFQVAAVYYDYAVDRGVIVMDRGTFRQYFGDLTPTGMAANSGTASRAWAYSGKTTRFCVT